MYKLKLMSVTEITSLTPTWGMPGGEGERYQLYRHMIETAWWFRTRATTANYTNYTYCIIYDPSNIGRLDCRTYNNSTTAIVPIIRLG